MKTVPDPLCVLLVDDHPAVRVGLRATLRQAFEGVRIEEADSASTALAGLSRWRPHLVLLDVNLPGPSGLDLARQILCRNPQLTILMVAADVDPWTVAAALKAGASGFVAKTASSAILLAGIRRVLVGNLFFCPEAEKALSYAEEGLAIRPLPPGPSILTRREREVLRYFAQGENTKVVAGLLGISAHTVQTHRQHICDKLGAQCIADLVRYSIRHGLVRL